MFLRPVLLRPVLLRPVLLRPMRPLMILLHTYMIHSLTTLQRRLH